MCGVWHRTGSTPSWRCSSSPRRLRQPLIRLIKPWSRSRCTFCTSSVSSSRALPDTGHTQEPASLRTGGLLLRMDWPHRNSIAVPSWEPEEGILEAGERKNPLRTAGDFAVRLGRLELPHPAPEAGALSTELQALTVEIILEVPP